MTLKDEIQTIKRSDGKINVAITRRDTYKQSQLHRQILDATNFLPPTSTLQERVYCVECGIITLQLCCICSAPAHFQRTHNKGYSETCSNRQCVAINTVPVRKQTMIDTYGSLVSPKSRQSMKDRAPEFHKKARSTMMNRYGVELPGQMKGNSSKALETKLTRYGGTRTPEVASEQTIQRVNRFKSMTTQVNVTAVTKAGDNVWKVSFVCNTCTSKLTQPSETFKWRCDKDITPCVNCLPLNYTSVKEQSLVEHIRELIPDIEIRTSDRTILPNGYELDMVFPQYNVAVEFDGLFWHSYGGHPDSRINSRYHLNKTNECEALGYKLIHVFENEWDQRPDVVVSRIVANLGYNKRKVYARDCMVDVILDKTIVSDFCNQYHTQGHVGFVVAYGLYYNGELLCCMTFGNPRYSDAQWELLRFCNTPFTMVVGGASKLFSRFVRDCTPNAVVSYANRRWSPIRDNTVYEKMGFTFQRNSQPSYYYFKSHDGVKLHNRVTFQKHKLRDKLESFDPNLTEMQNMFTNGYRVIWDCGNQVWMWTVENCV